MSQSPRIAFTYQDFVQFAFETGISKDRIENVYSNLIDAIEGMDELLASPVEDYPEEKNRKSMEILSYVCQEGYGNFSPLSAGVHVGPEPSEEYLEFNFGWQCVAPETKRTFYYSMFLDSFIITDDYLSTDIPEQIRFSPFHFLYAFGEGRRGYGIPYESLSKLLANVYRRILKFDENVGFTIMTNYYRRLDRFLAEILRVVDHAVGGYGVERIDHDLADSWWHSLLCLYVNLGDTYSTTLIFNPSRASLEISSWGDFIEAIESAAQGDDENEGNDDEDEGEEDEGEEDEGEDEEGDA